MRTIEYCTEDRYSLYVPKVSIGLGKQAIRPTMARVDPTDTDADTDTVSNVWT